MTLREQFENETGEPSIYNPNRIMGEAIRVNIEYLEWLESKLQNTSSNSEYTEIKMCAECGKYSADLPSELCQGCNAYKAHF